MRSSTSWGFVVVVSLGSALSAQRSDEDLQLALGLIQRGLHAEAARSLESFLDAQPRHERAAEAFYRLGVCRAETGKGDAAIAAWQKALQRGAFALRPECRYRLGHALKDAGKLAPSLEQFRKLADESAADHYLATPARYAAGECCRDLGDPERALAFFDAAAKGGGDEYGLPSLYQAGFALLGLERLKEASERFGRAADGYPEHEAATECRYLQGDAALRAGAVKIAEDALQKVCAAGGDFADDAALGIAWCKLEGGDAQAALREFRRVVEDHPRSPLRARARLEAGRLLHRAGKHADAAAELRPLVELVDEGDLRDIRRDALELSGLSALQAGAAEPALRALGAAEKLEPAPAAAARIAYGIGEAHAELGQWREALEAYRRCAKFEGDAALSGDARYGECLALHKLGEFEPSLEIARRFATEHREHRLVGHAQFAMGENLFALKRYADAGSSYEALPEDHALARRAAFKRAWCVYLQGNREAAGQSFRALADDAKDAIAEEALSMAALAFMESEAMDRAITAADLYKVRYPEGQFLARTERVASRVLRARGELNAAAQRIASAAQRASSQGEAVEDRLEQAELTFRQGDFDQAAELYGALGERDDGIGVRAVEGLAWCAFELGDDAKCLAQIARGLGHPAAAGERSGLLELQLAVHQRTEQWAEAVRSAQAFLSEFAEHPRAPAIQFGLGLAHARAGNHARAREVLAALAERGGFERMDRVHYELAWACRRDGDEAAALAAFAKVSEISEDRDLAGEGRFHVGEAMLKREGRSEGDVARARELLGQVQGKHRGRALYRIGFSWIEAKRAREAVVAFDEMLALAEKDQLGSKLLLGEARFFAGECRLELEDYAPAAEHYRALLRDHAEHERAPAARLSLGRCAVLLEQPAEAVAVLRAFLAQGDEIPKADRARAHLWLGRAHLDARQFERAETALRTVTELSDGELAAEAQYRLGDSRAGRDDLNGAVDAYVKLSILYGHDEWVQRALLQAARCYEKLEQPAKAVKFYGELAERFPDAETTKEARAAMARLGKE